MGSAMTSERFGFDAATGGVGPEQGGLAVQLRRLAAAGCFDLPQPGCGHTRRRLRRLGSIAAEHLALARLAEAHLDAVTILREAGRQPELDRLYGVWASDAPHAHLALTTSPPGGRAAVVVDGRKAFCTGWDIVDRALITVRDADGVTLVDLSTNSPRISADTSEWMTPAFADTNTATITITQLDLDPGHIVGTANWYLDRIGFWHGALAPAACWAGGAIGLVDHCFDLARQRQSDDHMLTHLGVLEAARWELEVVLDAAGDTVDAFPDDRDVAVRLAQQTRSSVERIVAVIIDHAVRAFGPRLLAHDLWAARRVSELQLYVRQHHDSRDHAALGSLCLHTVDSARRWRIEC
jgi:hypothetical protein